MILFVCTGNTCRSPMAAALCVARGVPAESAGLNTEEGKPATGGARWEMSCRGLDITAHRSRNVTQDMCARAERVIAMTPWHLAVLKSLFPKHAHRMLCFDPPIEDPYGQEDYVYHIAANDMDKQLEILLKPDK